MFMSQYSAGKQQGLQRINAARAQPSYGGYHYKVRRGALRLHYLLGAPVAASCRKQVSCCSQLPQALLLCCSQPSLRLAAKRGALTGTSQAVRCSQGPSFDGG